MNSCWDAMQDTVSIVLEKCQFESGGNMKTGQHDNKWFCSGKVILYFGQFFVVRMLQRFCLQPDEQGFLPAA